MKRRSTFLAVSTAVAVAGTIGVLSNTSAHAATSGPITGLGGKCVDVASASTANGAHVQTYDCNGSAAQRAGPSATPTTPYRRSASAWT